MCSKPGEGSRQAQAGHRSATRVLAAPAPEAWTAVGPCATWSLGQGAGPQEGGITSSCKDHRVSWSDSRHQAGERDRDLLVRDLLEDQVIQQCQLLCYLQSRVVFKGLCFHSLRLNHEAREVGVSVSWLQGPSRGRCAITTQTLVPIWGHLLGEAAPQHPPGATGQRFPTRLVAMRKVRGPRTPLQGQFWGHGMGGRREKGQHILDPAC